MLAQKKFTKPIHGHLLEERYNFDEPSQRRGEVTPIKMAVLVILTVVVALHTLSLATPYLAKFQPAIPYVEVYQVQFGESPATDINMGLWKVCSKAWTSECVSWARTSQDAATGGLKQIKAPGWLIGAQATSLAGTVIAFISDVIVLLHLLVLDKGMRLFPVLICLGSLIAGTLVFISNACLAFNYKTIPKHVAQVAFAATGSPVDQTVVVWSQSNFFFSLNWGFALEIMSTVLLWVSGVLIMLGRGGRIDI